MQRRISFKEMPNADNSRGLALVFLAAKKLPVSFFMGDKQDRLAIIKDMRANESC